MPNNIELLEDRRPKRLTARQYDMLAGKVSQKYDSWREAAQPHIDEIKKIRKYIYQSQKGEHPEGDPYALSSIYKLNEAFKSHIKENVYPTNAAVFDVKGDDAESEKTANLHKWDIVKDLEKIDFKFTKAEAFLNSFNESGEMIALVGLNKKTVKRKREVELPEMITGMDGGKIETTTIKLALEDVEVHDGVDVFPIHAEDFVFDTTKRDRFDNPVCGKIIRRWLSYPEIANNKTHGLLKGSKYGSEVRQYLKQSIENEEPDFDMLRDDVGIKDTKRDTFRGDQAEILEYWGNIEVDGKELKNYVVTLAGNRVIRCEPNPYYNNPIVYYARVVHPDYKRGVSPLRVAIRPADISSNIINEIITAFPYVANPVDYVPKGAIVNKKKKIPPGGQIEYDSDINKVPPFPKDVSGVLKGFDLIGFFAQQTEAAVGMSDAMLGAETEERKTATEIKAVQVGGSIRISDTIDGIKQGFNLPVVRKMADIKANFEEGDKTIGIEQGDGGIEEQTVTDEVRNGRYRYTYIDSKATMERQAQFKDLLAFLELVMKINPYVVNLDEILKHGLLETGMQNVEKFLSKDRLEEGIREYLKSIGMKGTPEEVEMSKKKITQYLPQIARGIMNGQEQTAQEPIPQPGVGAMPSNIPGRGLPTGGGM